MIVLSLAAFGTYELAAPGFAGAGAGEGPAPIWKPTGGNVLQVQVIGQQWRFTYRYPQFGGFETTQLMLPVNRPVQFNVTSLDVIHSFWAYQLGVKADANPGVNNVAYTTPTHTGHGDGALRRAVRPVARRDVQLRPGDDATRPSRPGPRRPRPSWRPSPRCCRRTRPPTTRRSIPQINKAMAKAGIAGANGYYYPPNDPAQP